jgi:hypothetical protein
VGSQDQVWAAYGGINVIVFNRDGTFQVSPVVISDERRQELNDHMMLFFTGFSRTAAMFAKKQIENLDNRERQLRIFHQMVGEGASILQDARRPIKEVGKLLLDAWKLKKELSPSFFDRGFFSVSAARAARLSCMKRVTRMFGLRTDLPDVPETDRTAAPRGCEKMLGLVGRWNAIRALREKRA